jgi:hypothetical protein
MLTVGFEPTHPEILELKPNALDHSAISALTFPINIIFKILNSFNLIIKIIKKIYYIIIINAF